MNTYRICETESGGWSVVGPSGAVDARFAYATEALSFVKSREEIAAAGLGVSYGLIEWRTRTIVGKAVARALAASK